MQCDDLLRETAVLQMMLFIVGGGQPGVVVLHQRLFGFELADGTVQRWQVPDAGTDAGKDSGIDET